jgi:hypothetical protein
MSSETPRPEVMEALSTLNAYLRGALSLDELIEWAEHRDARPADNAWVRRVSADLANPLLCRELATALIHEHLRAITAAEGANR